MEQQAAAAESRPKISMEAEERVLAIQEHEAATNEDSSIYEEMEDRILSFEEGDDQASEEEIKELWFDFETMFLLGLGDLGTAGTRRITKGEAFKQILESSPDASQKAMCMIENTFDYRYPKDEDNPLAEGLEDKPLWPGEDYAATQVSEARGTRLMTEVVHKNMVKHLGLEEGSPVADQVNQEVLAVYEHFAKKLVESDSKPGFLGGRAVSQELTILLNHLQELGSTKTELMEGLEEHKAQHEGNVEIWKRLHPRKDVRDPLDLFYPQSRGAWTN